jgi:asparagine synthase (glutamine-hydrolysing)
VHGLLSFGAIPEPLTIVRDVVALPPGHFLRVAVVHGRLSAPALVSFESAIAPPALPPPANPAAASTLPAEALLAKSKVLAPLLRETVAQHLVADVPVALLLSGGVDSTAVAALARAAAPTARLASFTLTYGDQDPHSEGAAARRTAEALGLVHHDCVISPDAALLALPRFLAAQDQPSIDGFNTYLISEKVHAAGYKVALSGLGGDELFLGYQLHRAFAAAWLLGEVLPGPAAGLAAATERLPKVSAGRFMKRGSPLATALATALGRLPKAASVLAGAALPPAERAVALYTRLRALWSPAEVAALLAPDLGIAALTAEAHLPQSPALLLALGLGPEAAGGRAADRSVHARIRFAYHVVMQLERRSYLRDTLLRDADALSMAHGVELRVPLCDSQLWQRVSELGPEPTLRNKQLLVAAVGHPLVTAAAARPKRGFALPLHRWLPGPLRATVSSCLDDRELLDRAGLSRAAPRALASYLDEPTERMTYRVWSLYTLLAYVKRHGLGL